MPRVAGPNPAGHIIFPTTYGNDRGGNHCQRLFWKPCQHPINSAATAPSTIVVADLTWSMAEAGNYDAGCIPWNTDGKRTQMKPNGWDLESVVTFVGWPRRTLRSSSELLRHRTLYRPRVASASSKPCIALASCSMFLHMASIE